MTDNGKPVSQATLERRAKLPHLDPGGLPRPTFTSVFADKKREVWKHAYLVTLSSGTILGGTPSDPKLAESWLRTRLQGSDAAMAAAVQETILEALGRDVSEIEGMTPEDANALLERGIAKYAGMRGVQVFKRSASARAPSSNPADNGALVPAPCLEGRHLKASIKEAANVVFGKQSWGPTRKGTRAWFAEHVHVLDQYLPFDKDVEPELLQRVTHISGPQGKRSAISLQEQVIDGSFSAHIVCDSDEMTADNWAKLWLIGELQGIGATRSQGFGTYLVTRWERLPKDYPLPTCFDR